MFILSPGVDPTSALLQLAEHTGMAQRFHALSLGQGQAPIAARLLREGVVQGQCLPSSSAPNHGPGLTVHHLSPCCHRSSCSRRPWGLAPEHLDPPPKLPPQPEEQWGDRQGIGSGSHHISTSFQDTGCSSPTATCRCPGCRTWINWWSSCRWRIRTLPSASGSAPAPTQTSPFPSCRPASR